MIAPLAVGLSAAALVRAAQDGRQINGQTVILLMLCGATAIFLGGTILLSQSRAAYIGLAAGFFFMMIVVSWKWRLLAAVLMIVAGIGIVF